MIIVKGYTSSKKSKIKTSYLGWAHCWNLYKWLKMPSFRLSKTNLLTSVSLEKERLHTFSQITRMLNILKSTWESTLAWWTLFSDSEKNNTNSIWKDLRNKKKDRLVKKTTIQVLTPTVAQKKKSVTLISMYWLNVSTASSQYKQKVNVFCYRWRKTIW